jgi:hypothetical protein
MNKYLHRTFRMSDAGTDGTGGAEDTAGLKATIKALRGEVSTLQTELKKYAGIEDPAAAIAALKELPTVKQQAADLQTKLFGVQIDNAASTAVTGVLPQYRDLLLTNARGMLQVGEDGMVKAADGRSLDQLTTDYRKNYPQMFVATETTPVGAGTTPQNGATPPPAVTQVKASENLVGMNPDDLISGKVEIVSG